MHDFVWTLSFQLNWINVLRDNMIAKHAFEVHSHCSMYQFFIAFKIPEYYCYTDIIKDSKLTLTKSQVKETK